MISQIKKFIKRESFFFRYLAFIYNFPNYWKPPVTDISYQINNKLSKYKNVIFIQVGANDGITGRDFISENILKNKWKGVLIEPVPFIFKKLVKNYSNIENLHYENVALGNQIGNFPFYHFDESMGEWYSELGSFKKEVLYSHGIQNVDSIIKTSYIPTTTLGEVIEKYNIGTLHLLCIDTEGYDYEILKTIDFSKIRPKMILYEHKHLERNEYKESLSLLKKNGYEVFCENGWDTLAIIR